MIPPSSCPLFFPPDYQSTNDEYFIAMQADGNLYAYKGGRFLWGSCQVFNYRPANGQYTAVMQDDGNLCVYKHGSPSPLCLTIFEAPIVDVEGASVWSWAKNHQHDASPAGGEEFSFCELKPFVAVDYPWDPEGLIAVIHRESDALIRELRRDSQDEPDPASLPSTVTIDSVFVRNHKIPGQSRDQSAASASRNGRERLRVTNDTRHIVDAYWLGPGTRGGSAG